MLDNVCSGYFCLLMVYNIVDQGWNEDGNGKIRREPAFASASGYGRDATGFGGGDQPCRRYIAEDRACIWRCQNERIRDHIEHCDHNGKNRRGTAYTHQKSELYGQYGFYCTGTAQCTQQELLYQPHSAGPVSAAASGDRRAEGTMGSLYGKYPGSRQFCCVFWRDICRWSCGGTGGCPDLLYTAKSDETFCKYDHV